MKKEIVSLQEELMHQGEYIERMSDELYAQQCEINNLRDKIFKMEETIRILKDSDSNIRPLSEETPPPHY